jgi:Domain of unknown function DUF11
MARMRDAPTVTPAATPSRSRVTIPAPHAHPHRAFSADAARRGTARVSLMSRAMTRPPSIALTSFTLVAAATALTAACSGSPGENAAGSDEALSGGCTLAITKNSYDGPNYWGTVTVKNDGPAAATGYVVAFDVPSGAHCTNDSVPSGAKLSPLSGSGSSAATTSNHCVFTWASAKLASGASTTFNYSTDSTSFSAASNAKATSASCGTAPADAGAAKDSGTTADTGAGKDSGTTSTDAGKTTSDAGTATCGCNGAAGCAEWKEVYITFYGFNDNSCTVESQHDCDDIAYPGLGPKKHTGATEGAGTYDDPITAAASDQGWETSGGATLSPGTIIYNPEVEKYFIMEDSCLECGDEWKCHLSSDDTDDPNPPSGCKAGTYLHIDFWMGPAFQQDATNLNNCEDNSTFGNPYQGTGVVLVNPPANLPVKTTPLYTGSGSGGGCWTNSQVNGDSCP